MKRSVLLPFAWMASAILLLLFLPSPVRAQLDDYDFAMGAADRGYFDLAREALDEMLAKPGLTPQERTTAELGKVGILKRDADKETDADEKLRKYREAAKGYEAFVSDSANETHPKYFDAIFEYGELLQNLGEAIGRIIEDEQNPDRVNTLRAEGTEAVQKARKLLDDAATYLSNLPEGQRNELLLQKALFFKALNYYHEASLQAPGTFERDNNLKLASEGLEDFAWQYEGRASAWLALLYIGKCWGERALENSDKAEEYAQTGIEYLESITEALRTHEELYGDNWFMGLAQRAFYEIAHIDNSLKKYPDAIDTVKRMPEALKKPDGSETPLQTYGYLAELERVKALEAIQDLEAAIELCQKLAKDAEGGVARVLASYLAKLIEESKASGVADIKISPDVLFTTAQGFYSQQKWFRAIEYFQKVLVAIEDTGEQKEKLPQVWNYIGRAERRMDHYLAAAIAFETGAKLPGTDAKDETVEQNAFSAYNAYTQQVKLESRGKGPADFLTKAQIALRDYLRETYPGTGLDYYAAVDALEAGDFEEAIAGFNRVEKTNEVLYPRSQAKLAECFFDLGSKQAEDAGGKADAKARASFLRIETLKSDFERFIADPNWQTGNPQAVDERKQAQAAIDYWLARAKQASGDAEGALAILRDFPTNHKDQPNFVEGALYLLIQVLVDKGDLAGAESTLADFEKAFPKSKLTAAADLEIGQAYKREFNERVEQYAKAKGAKPEDVEQEFLETNQEAHDLLVKSSDYVKIWWDKQGQPFAKGLEIGNDYFRTGEYDKALEVLEAIYKRDKDNPKIPELSRRTLKLRLADTYLWHKRAKDAEPIYAELFDQIIGKRTGVVNAELREKYAMCLGGTAVLERNNQVVEYDGVEQYEKAKEIWRPIAESRQYRDNNDPMYWKAQFHMAYLDYKLGNIENAKRLLNNLMVLNADPIRNDPSGPLFEWLNRKLN